MSYQWQYILCFNFSFYTGVKSFSLALSEEAQLGNWQVQVQVDSAVFTSDLNVSLVDGTFGMAVPEVAMAEEHYVELRFGHEMRRLYKPGLPFIGKVCFLDIALCNSYLERQFVLYKPTLTECFQPCYK